MPATSFTVYVIVTQKSPSLNGVRPPVHSRYAATWLVGAQTVVEPASTLTVCSEPAKKPKGFATKEVRNGDLSLVHIGEP